VGTLVLHMPVPGMVYDGGELTATERAEPLCTAKGGGGWSATFVPLRVMHGVSPVKSGVRVSLTMPVYGEAAAAAAVPELEEVPEEVLQYVIGGTKRLAEHHADLLSTFQQRVKHAQKLKKATDRRVQALVALEGKTTRVTADAVQKVQSARSLLSIEDDASKAVVMLSEERGNAVERWALQQLQAEGATLEYAKVEGLHRSSIYGLMKSSDDSSVDWMDTKRPVLDNINVDHWDYPVASQPVIDSFNKWHPVELVDHEDDWPEAWSDGARGLNVRHTAVFDEAFVADVSVSIPTVTVKFD